MQKWANRITNMGACSDAVEWLEREKFQTSQMAWDKCDRGDWMLWLLGKLSGKPQSDSRKKLVLATCACARLALPYVVKGEERPLRAIDTAEKWARREDGVTMKDVQNAAAAAEHAAYDVAYDAADDAAAYFASYAAYYAAYTHYTTEAASYAAEAASYAAARAAILRECANKVREIYPEAPL